MQFATSLVSLVLAAASVRAAPGTSVKAAARQETPRVYVKFFSDNACLGTWVEDTVWVQNPTDTCLDVNIPEGYNSFLVVDNYDTTTLRVFSLNGCNTNTGNYVDIAPGVEQCYAQHAGSVEFLSS
ncbi:Uu.00g126390.m01.CDS01 [Anthostomella pinea]|uniref:Uu.00g126390.m01.CDS01 n=1 Tax=Anthostomella pinea TaxID=933095 RepID=A0AAI8VIW3_9PEZI|nr:Uu.00g126390.m01.CDS01 [Anthostomella pinea]